LVEMHVAIFIRKLRITQYETILRKCGMSHQRNVPVSFLLFA